MSVVILHLSDLHFGAEKGRVSGLDERKVVLSSLSNYIKTLPKEWHPNIVCISGDIGFAGKENDYKAATEWLNQLIKEMGLTPNDIIVCPGNHDLDRDVRGICYPPDTKTADEFLAFPVPEHFKSRFKELTQFCKDFKIPPVKIHEEENYLCGYRIIKDIKFIVMNSAWFSLNKSDKGNLWLGLPLIRSLEADNIVAENKAGEDIPRISLFHHPREWLNENELIPYASSTPPRPSTLDYISMRCNIILTGHTHGSVRPPDRIAGSAWHITSGSTFDNGHHFNNFALLKVQSDGFTLRRFEFDPRASYGAWASKGDTKFYRFYDLEQIVTPETSSITIPGIDLEELKERAASFAQREMEKKSRALKKEGELPNLVLRKVSSYIRGERYNVGDRGKIYSGHSEIRESLNTAITRSPRTLLLGELGCGKSTLVAQLITYLVRQERVLSFYIPAGRLKGCSFETVTDALNAISAFIKNQFIPECGDFHLLNLLNQGTEITLVLDGLDELNLLTARKLLERMSDIVHQWVNFRVVATGRPVELIGFNYKEWQLLELPSLDEDEMFKILLSIALSTGCSLEVATEEARLRLSVLKRRSELFAVASTPMFLRLLYPHLEEGGSVKGYTLGTLLFDLLEEKLLKWGHREVREALEPSFESIYSTSLSRFALLGCAAHEMSLAHDGVISRGALELAIQEYMKERGEPQHLASEGVSFLVRQVLIDDNGIISFPVQPLFECALAAYHFDRLISGKLGEPDLKIPWRIISFMANLVSRNNRINAYREWFSDYLSSLINVEQNVPAAAYIATEADDQKLASHVLTQFGCLGFRPLRIFGDDRGYSAQCLSYTIKLAGDEGMLWFYEQYLDPTKPISDTTINLVDGVLSYWVALQSNKISDQIKERLQTIIPAHLAVSYYASKRILAPIALILSQEFSVQQRVELYIELLWKGPLQGRARSALLGEVELGHKNEVLEALRKAARVGFESSGLASELWLKLNTDSDTVPPLAVLRGAIKGGYGKRENSIVAAAWLSWADRNDTKRINALLRAWLSSEDGELACTAACVLSDRGVNDWLELAPAIIRGLHDGGRVEQGEQKLRKLIESGGEQALKWLVDQFDSNVAKHELRHSSEWRILLGGLLRINKPKPKWLCHAVAGMNDFILSRYPEIRQSFSDLLKGVHSSVYISELRKQLYSSKPEVRKRTACVLATVFPDSESKALEIALQGDYETGATNWEVFAQHLQLGPSVLSHLRTYSKEWREKARTHSLLLLYRNGVELKEPEWVQLIAGTLKGYMFIDFTSSRYANPKFIPVLADDKAYPYLALYLGGTEKEQAKAAASALLTYFPQRLTHEQRAKACFLNLSFSMDFNRLLSERNRAAKNVEYLKVITEECAKHISKGDEEPAFSLLIRTLKEPSTWKRIIWDCLFKKEFQTHFNIEFIGEQLYEIALRDSDVQLGISNAVTEFLYDPRVKESRLIHGRQMLGLLGHCFNVIDNESLKQLLVLSKTSSKGLIDICIIARLGGVVHDYKKDSKRREDEMGVSISSESIKFQDLENRIENALMPSNEFHPDFFDLLELRLLANELRPEHLMQYSCAGHWGGWFSLIAEYYLHEVIDLSHLASLTKDWSLTPESSKLNSLYKRMRKIRWKFYYYISNNEEERIRFISELRALGVLKHGDEAIRVMLLLINRAELNNEEINSLFDRVASTEIGFGWTEFMDLFVSWIIEEAVKHLEIVRSAIQRGLHILSNYEHKYGNDGITRVLFPSLAWMLGEPPDKYNVGVFFYGLHKILHPYNITNRHNLDNAYQLLDPIWDRIPMDIIHSVVSMGVHSEQPEVRMVCRLLASFAKSV